MTGPRPVAVITGASAGIGRIYADRLAARGFDLVLVARDARRLDEVGRELAQRYCVSVEPLAADLAREEEMIRVGRRLAAIASLEILVNNAGFGTVGRLVDADPERQADMVRLHALAATRLVQAVLPGLVRRGRGAIVNVASVASFVYSPGNANYCATKAYLRVLTEGLAAELRGTGVQAQALCPGFTHTEFHERMGFEKSQIGRRLWMSAEDVVDASLRALDRGGPVVCVPGVGYRLLTYLIQLSPRGLIGRVARTREAGQRAR